jgi:hypothetical protein
LNKIDDPFANNSRSPAIFAIMPSWQAQFVKLIVRLHIRRRKWGNDEAAFVRRARRVFGAPRFYQRLQSYDVDLAPIRDAGVAGEWITPKHADEGRILYLHGGGYVSCSAATHRPITAALVRLSRFPVFALNYRLAPEFRFPAALDDAMAAYEWLIGQGTAGISLAGIQRAAAWCWRCCCGRAIRACHFRRAVFASRLGRISLLRANPFAATMDDAPCFGRRT